MAVAADDECSSRTLLETQPLTIQYTGAFPDNLKLIKTISVPPLKLIGAAYINPRTQKFGYSISCKVSIFQRQQPHRDMHTYPMIPPRCLCLTPAAIHVSPTAPVNTPSPP